MIEASGHTRQQRAPLSVWLRFLLPSAIGIFGFLIPILHDGTLTIPMVIANDLLNEWLAPILPELVISILAISALITAVVVMGPSRIPERWPALARLFDVGWTWLLLRVLALIVATLIVMKAGPEFVWGDSTGKVVFYDLALAVVTLFIVASLLLPLLTDYGLMEVVGAALSPLFRACFTLPGRSAVDASASWFSAAAVGILITSQQYVAGYYSAREACVIATNFSVVSLPFCLLIATVLGIEERFFEYYLVVIAAGLTTALILPRIPPLSRIRDTWWEGVTPPVEAPAPGLRAQLRQGLRSGLERAASAPGPRSYLRHATLNLLDIWFGLIPGVIVVGLSGMVLAEYTSVDEWLTLPLIPLLEIMGLPEASTAAPTFVVGFADQFLPAAMGQSISSELTRFVIAGISVSQLIYMSEVGILILKSPIPLRFSDMLLVFVLRTLITTPIFIAAGRLLGFGAS